MEEEHHDMNGTWRTDFDEYGYHDTRSRAARTTAFPQEALFLDVLRREGAGYRKEILSLFFFHVCIFRFFEKLWMRAERLDFLLFEHVKLTNGRTTWMTE